MREVLINKKNGENIVCILENGQLCERYIYSEKVKQLLGNIYVGRVDKVIEGMQSAFVDIGEEKNAFLSLEDAMKKVDETKTEKQKNVKINEILKEKQKIIVQVKKEPCREKGARVSTHITIPGKYVVIMPYTSILTISQKIENEEEKVRLKEIVKNELPEGFGAIIRTDAEDLGEKIIKNDVREILEKWQTIKETSSKTDDVSLIYSNNDLTSTILREIVDKTTEKICTNNKDVYEELKKAGGNCEIELIEDEDLIEKYMISDEYDSIEDRKIWLKCGGQIVIDKTEALTAIDVNSEKCTGKTDLETTIYKVNKEAAVEIMKQIRLKDIGGIIVIDYIDMKDEKHKEEILEIMKKEAKKDRSKIDIKHFTELNLVELARKKMHP